MTDLHKNQNEIKIINFTKAQKWGFVGVLFFIGIWTYLPFFQHVDKSHAYTNLSALVTLIQYINLVVGIVSVLVIGKDIYAIGPKRGFLISCTILGFCYLMNGLIGLVENVEAFVVLDIIRSLIINIGIYAILIFTYVLIAVGYPGRVGTIFGTTVVGLIILLKIFPGVFIGHFIQEKWGVVAHSVIVGFMVFIGAALAYFAIPASTKILPDISTSTAQNDCNYKTIIKTTSVWVACFGVFVASLASTSTAFWAPLHSFYQVSQAESNLSTILSILPVILVITTISAPIIGWICDKSLDLKWIGLVGAGSMCFGRALTMPENLWTNVIGLLFETLGWTAIFVSAFPQALRLSAISTNETDYIHTHGTNQIEIAGRVSALLITSQKFGVFTGSQISVFLYNAFGSYFISSWVLLSLYVGIGLVYCYTIFYKKSELDAIKRPDSEGVTINGQFNHHSRIPDANASSMV